MQADVVSNWITRGGNGYLIEVKYGPTHCFFKVEGVLKIFSTYREAVIIKTAIDNRTINKYNISQIEYDSVIKNQQK